MNRAGEGYKEVFKEVQMQGRFLTWRVIQLEADVLVEDWS